MSGKLALFYKEKDYFLTSNVRSSFQISTRKSLRQKKGGKERKGRRKAGERGSEAEQEEKEGETQRLCMNRSKKYT